MIPTGLLGGSFNPAHGGHRDISLFAIDALDLDEYWWLVSPGNPLKPKAGMAPLAARLGSAQVQARRSPIKVTAIERELGTVYTVDTLRKIVARYPKVRFIWIMGADNLPGFPSLAATGRRSPAPDADRRYRAARAIMIAPMQDVRWVGFGASSGPWTRNCIGRTGDRPPSCSCDFRPMCDPQLRYGRPTPAGSNAMKVALCAIR